jgi:type II secretion system protein D
MNKTCKHAVKIASSAALFAVAASGPAISLADNAPAVGREAAAKPARVKLITLDYVNAEVVDVIRALSAQSGINVALNPGVKGQVTVHLKDKTVDDAMVTVANLAGLGARRVNDTYVFAPRAEMRQTIERLGTTKRIVLTVIEGQAAADVVQNAFPDVTARPQGKAVTLIGTSEDLEAAERLLQQNDRIAPDDVRTTEKFALKFIPAAQAATSVCKMTPGLTAEAAGTAVVLTGTKAMVEAGRKGLEMIDVQGAPDKEMRVYQVRYVSALELIQVLERTVPDVKVNPGPGSYAPDRAAFNPISSQFVGIATSGAGGPTNGTGASSGSALASGAGGGANGAAGAAGSPLNAKALSLLLQGSPAALDQAVKVLSLMDVAPQQIHIEAKIVETNPSVAEEYGLKWSWTRFGFYEAAAGTQVDTGSTGGPGGDFSSFRTKNNGPGVFSRVPFSFQAVLSAMITKRDAKLLANPSISVINDQDASIFIGDTLRFQTLATSGPTTGNQFTVVEVPVGIILLVHPRVNEDGMVTLRMHPVVSTVTGLINGLPQTSAREAETTVRVKDGDTLVIGGLIRDEDIREMSKIPILGDLPIIGQLFRNTSRNHRRTEVMIVLTVRMQK